MSLREANAMSNEAISTTIKGSAGVAYGSQ